jgi:phosphomannomutase
MWASSVTLASTSPVRPFKKSVSGGWVDGARTAAAGRAAIAQISDRDGVKYILADNSWLLIRPSGTEPVLRIYAEARTDAQVKALLKEGAAWPKRRSMRCWRRNKTIS